MVAYSVVKVVDASTSLEIKYVPLFGVVKLALTKKWYIIKPTAMRTNITIPDEWVPALRRLAKQRGMSLARLLCEGAFKMLPPAERKKLPPAKERGRPRNDD
jgi:hypothetical protein